MTREPHKVVLWPLIVGASLAVGGCGSSSGSDDDDSENRSGAQPDNMGGTSSNDSEGSEAEPEDTEGLQMCCELGAVCHVVGLGGDPKVAACHELGHRRSATDCRDAYAECLEACEGVTDSPMEHACD